MNRTRTQIYLDPRQHKALLKEARAGGRSLAGVIRGLVDEHLGRHATAPEANEHRKAALSLIGLGSSGSSDVSENADEYLAAALRAELVRDRPLTDQRRRRRRPR